MQSVRRHTVEIQLAAAREDKAVCGVRKGFWVGGVFRVSQAERVGAAEGSSTGAVKG